MGTRLLYCSFHCNFLVPNQLVRYGTVVNVRIIRDAVTLRHRGYGFVRFQRHEEAVNAKNAMHGADIGGRIIRVGWAMKNCSLMVCEVDASLTSEKLRCFFLKFGKLNMQETYVVHSTSPLPHSLDIEAVASSHAMVRYEDRSDAERAFAELNSSVAKEILDARRKEPLPTEGSSSGEEGLKHSVPLRLVWIVNPSPNASRFGHSSGIVENDDARGMPVLISQLMCQSAPPRMTNQLPSNPMNNGARVEEGQNYLNYEEPKYLGPKGGKGSGRGMTQSLKPRNQSPKCRSVVHVAFWDRHIILPHKKKRGSADTKQRATKVAQKSKTADGDNCNASPKEEDFSAVDNRTPIPPSSASSSNSAADLETDDVVEGKMTLPIKPRQIFATTQSLFEIFAKYGSIEEVVLSRNPRPPPPLLDNPEDIDTPPQPPTGISLGRNTAREEDVAIDPLLPAESLSSTAKVSTDKKGRNDDGDDDAKPEKLLLQSSPSLRLRGAGMVHFEYSPAGISSAKKAVSALHGALVHNVILHLTIIAAPVSRIGKKNSRLSPRREYKNSLGYKADGLLPRARGIGRVPIPYAMRTYVYEIQNSAAQHAQADDSNSLGPYYNQPGPGMHWSAPMHYFWP